MDDKIKQKWIIALRSGNYEQGKNNLRSKNNTYCCLGLLCDIIDPDAWRLSERDIGCSIKGHKGHYYAHPLMRALGRQWLSEEALEQVGLTNAQQRTLSKLNDEGVTFYQISFIIESFA